MFGQRRLNILVKSCIDILTCCVLLITHVHNVKYFPALYLSDVRLLSILSSLKALSMLETATSYCRSLSEDIGCSSKP